MDGLISQAAALLRARGGRMTVQRQLILETLEGMGGHPSAQEVYLAARQHDRTLHSSTVYRTLNWLESTGLVSHRHLDTRQDGERCERFDPRLPIEHHHFVCAECGEVIEFDSPYVEKAKDAVARQYRVRIEYSSLTMHGLCAECDGPAQR